MNKMVDWALLYGRRGYAVFPIHGIARGRCTCRSGADCHSPGKHPRWEARTLENGVKDATTDERQIQAWWGTWPNANIGIATGGKSGVVVVDVDGEAGEKSIKALSRRCGSIPETLTAKTGRGFHLFFNTGGGEFDSRAGLFDGIDVRGEGGYVVAAPSVHVTGTRYAWAGDAKRANLPGWLKVVLTGRAPLRQNFDRPSANPKGTKEFEMSDVAPIKQGERNARLLSVAGQLRKQGKTAGEIWELLVKINKEKCKPPVREGELKSIAGRCEYYRTRDGEGRGMRPLPPAPFTHKETKGGKRMTQNGLQIKNS